MKTHRVTAKRAGLVLAFALMFGKGMLCPPVVQAQVPALQTGDVLVVRTPSSPVALVSYWTHVAVADGCGSVIEAMPGGPVRRTSVAQFWASYPQIQVQRLRANSQVLGLRMAVYASSQIGQPYTIWPAKRGMDCVELIRQSYIFAICDWRIWWIVPDNIAWDSRFVCVGRK